MSRSASLMLRCSLVVGAAIVVTGCATAPGAGPAAVVQPAVGAPLMPSALFAGGAERFFAWGCSPEQDLVTSHPDNEMRLWSAHGNWRLDQAVVASGARYQHGDLSFWNKGNEAFVEGPKGRLECQIEAQRQVLTRSERPGVMFFARGNEPDWSVSLAHDKPELELTLGYGSQQQTLPYRVTTLDNSAGRMILASGRGDSPFELRIEGQACFDNMSGEPYPAQVTLTLNGEQYRGCGQGIAP